MIALLLLAAATDMPALPRLGKPIGDPARWFTGDDYNASREGGAARFRTIFSKDGMPESCMIEESTGNAAVEQLACRRANERFRFQPSFDSEGQPAPRVYVRAVRFGPDAFDKVKPMPAYLVTLPIKGRPQLLDVTVDVDATGRLRGCATPESKRLTAFGAAICQALAASWRLAIENDASSKPMRYVRDLSILIRPAPAS